MGRFDVRSLELILAIASLLGGGIGGGSNASPEGSTVCRSSAQATSLGNAMWTGPIRGVMAVRKARRTLASVS